ncbi:hypothetical protein V6Z12_A08G106200 [Gossypium hirsutum]
MMKMIFVFPCFLFNHQCTNLSNHKQKPNKQNLIPRIFTKARKCSVFSGVRKNMDETNGQYHTSNKSFDDGKKGVLGKALGDPSTGLMFGEATSGGGIGGC